MEDPVKKMLYTGVGFAARLVDEFSKAIQELESKSNPYEEKGQSIVDNVLRKTENERAELRKKIDEITQEAKEKIDDVNSILSSSKDTGSPSQDIFEKLKKLEEALFGIAKKEEPPVSDDGDQPKNV